MSGEIVKIVEGVGIVGAKGMVSLFNILSAFGGAIVGGILTFLGSLWIFNQQRKHDEKKIKIEKSLELLYNIDKILDLVVSEIASGRYQLPSSNLFGDNRKRIDAIRAVSDVLGQTRVLYYYVFSKDLNIMYSVEYVLNQFIQESEGIEDINHDEITEICKEDEIKLRKIKEDIEHFIK